MEASQQPLQLAGLPLAAPLSLLRGTLAIQPNDAIPGEAQAYLAKRLTDALKARPELAECRIIPSNITGGAAAHAMHGVMVMKATEQHLPAITAAIEALNHEIPSQDVLTQLASSRHQQALAQQTAAEDAQRNAAAAPLASAVQQFYARKKGAVLTPDESAELLKLVKDQLYPPQVAPASPKVRPT